MSWTQPDLEAVARLVSQRTGITFGNRSDSAELGIRRAMARARVTDAQRYLEVIAADGKALDELISELTVGETYFFREPAQFQLIRHQMLPEIRRRRGNEHVIRAWSAACASGEEVYSLAILFEEEGLGDKTHLLATDICQKALAKARRAVYGQWSLRGEMAKAALPYLVPGKNGYRLDEKFRPRVAFAPLNLALDVYPSFATGAWGMDLILCRNVLIYLDAETIGKVGQRLYQTLAEGGWLITAAADPPLWDSAAFEVVTTEQGLFYRRPVSKDEDCRMKDESSFILQSSSFTADSASLVPNLTGESPQPTLTPSPLPLGREKETGGATDLLNEARQGLLQGDYAGVVRLTRDFLEDIALAAIHVRALANLDLAAAEQASTEAAARHRLSPELNYLHALLLLELGREEESVRAVRRVLYLDRSLAIAHFTLGSMLRRRGDLAGARRAFRNARDLCCARPADDLLPLADGEPAGRLAEAASFELALLSGDGEP